MSDTGTETFFTSRWIDGPEHVRDAPDTRLPGGFRAAGVACGIKPSGAPDLALLVSDAPGTTSAARFTRSGTLSAPVLLTMERTTLAALRAIVVNSGNANASTGRPGLDNAAKMQGAAAIASGVGSESGVAVASTGVIGVQLPMEVIIPGIAEAARTLRPDGASDFAEAIRTTDAYAKQASLEVTLSARHGAAERAGEGRGDDLTRLCDPARIRPDRRHALAGDRRPAARCHRQALV